MALLLLAAPAVALPQEAAALEDLRLLGGVYVQDVEDRKEDTYAANLELSVAAPWSGPGWGQAADWFLTPRLHVGTNINTGGDTSTAYTGLTWETGVLGPLFIAGSFGLAVHDGELNPTPAQMRQSKTLGTRWLFHESVELGLRSGAGYAISAVVEHYSNAGIGGKANEGLTNAGVRLRIPLTGGTSY